VKVGIIGTGLQGKRRASVFPTRSESKVLAIACGHPADEISSRALASIIGAKSYASWEEVVARDDIDAVIICTPPHLHAEMAIKAMETGKHVLCEKPLARTLEEAKTMVEKAREFGVTLKCGFNHRHHQGILQAKAWVDSGELGELDFARCRYGICGRPGYEKEWRANPALVSGGQLMEQGIHAIDLFRWFLGNFSEISAFVATRYWKNIRPLEDNAFVMLRSQDHKIAELHSSLTQWKNHFSFDLFGHEGYASVEGLGGSYGTERAILGKRGFDRPFSERVVEYRGAVDPSWRYEWEEFESAVAEQRDPMGSAKEGLEAMRLVFAAYDSNKKGVVVRL
jgi:predicted dehydrogenase